MKVLLIGNGGREHALAWKLAQSRHTTELLCVAGNAGISKEPKTACRHVDIEDVDALVAFSVEWKPDLVVVGPEAPLVAGIVDRLESLRFSVLGPNQRASQLEGSKAFAKQMMKKARIPTADFEVFDKYADAVDFVRRHKQPWVVKADGLAAGKGVILCNDVGQAEAALENVMLKKEFGDAGDLVVIEKTLLGQELSCIALTDGETIRLLASSKDHKRVFDKDKGPNTGGMGAYSPGFSGGQDFDRYVSEKILEPLVAELSRMDIRYQGIIYAGLMITSDGPQVLEFNVRLGDPETQPLMMRLRSDLIDVMTACVQGRLHTIDLEWDPRPAACVVMASGGYPGTYQKGKPIHGLSKIESLKDVKVFHAGTGMNAGQLVTTGGRVLGVTALGNDVQQAARKAYSCVAAIHFDNAQYRTDIGYVAGEIPL